MTTSLGPRRESRMRRAFEWLLIVVTGLLIVGLMAYARGPKHYRGDEIGSHDTKVVVVHIEP